MKRAFGLPGPLSPVALVVCGLGVCGQASAAPGDYRYYNGDGGGSHYSGITQITRQTSRN